MKLIRLFDQVDNIYELCSTAETDESHHREENVDVLAEEDRGVKHVESEEAGLGDSDHPNLLDLDEGEGRARNEDADLIAQVEDDVSVLIHELVLAGRVQVDDLLSVCHCERCCNCVLQEVNE